MSHRPKIISDAQLLDDLSRVGRLLGQTQLSQTDYAEIGRYSFITICRRFGSWQAALHLAGLEPASFMNVTAEMLLADIRRVAEVVKPEQLRANQYTLLGKYSRKIVDRLFGRWQTAAEAAGLVPVICRPRSERELFENLKNLWQHLGRQPRYEDFTRRVSKFGITAYTTRFGTLRNSLKIFLQWQAGLRPEVIQTKRGPRTIHLRLRFAILSRDHFRCQACGRSPATDPGVRLQVDHVVPWSRGGESVTDNLQTLCEKCNFGKSDCTP